MPCHYNISQSKLKKNNRNQISTNQLAAYAYSLFFKMADEGQTTRKLGFV